MKLKYKVDPTIIYNYKSKRGSEHNFWGVARSAFKVSTISGLTTSGFRVYWIIE